MYSRGHAILGVQSSAGRRGCAPQAEAAEDASYKQEVEKWDTDSDSQESDKDEEQTRSRRCCSDARARRRGGQGGEDVWCGTLVVR